MRFILSAIFLLLFVPVLVAQDAASPQVVTEYEARQHLVRITEPVYPPIARAARIQGDVVIEVVIDREGKVVSEKILSGHPMLRQAARWHRLTSEFVISTVGGPTGAATAT